jgi:2-oxoglutarate dehydrogenase E2 component (dihydrolipoamide succinyltransferase)
MPTPVEIRAPAEQTEGTRSQILRWLKSIGDPVVAHEPLIEIETDKVTVEVASPGSGTLREIVKQEQEQIAPGDLLGTIEANGQVETGVSRGAAGAETARGGEPVSAGAGGRGGTDGSLGSSRGSDSGSGAGSTPWMLSPAIRRLIAERGLDPVQIRASGAGGRITVADVLSHNSAGNTGTDNVGVGGEAGASANAETIGNSPIADREGSVRGGGIAISLAASRRIPHTATRKRIAEHMVQSLLQTAPHVTTVFEADMSAVVEHRQRHKEEFAARGVPLTLTAYFLQAAVAAIREVPEANSRWTDDALEIFDTLHIGVATALDTGLVVPVVRDMQSRDLFETAKVLDDVVSRTREGRLTPADVRGGTFTISNHGVSGSLLATPIVINQPQAAILGVGKLEKRTVVVSENGEDRIILRPQCYITLTIDHRVMDGHQANRFLQVFVDWLATPHG